MPPMQEAECGGQERGDAPSMRTKIIGGILFFLLCISWIHIGLEIYNEWKDKKQEGPAYPFLMNCGVLDHYNQTISEIEIKSYNPVETIELGYRYNATFRIVCYQMQQTTLGEIQDGR